SGWIPGESVQIYFNGGLVATLPANADGILSFGITTGAGFGFVTIENIGLTSGKDTGGVVQVAPTGPYLPGVTGAPHAVNATVSGKFYLAGAGYPASTTVTIYRNAVSLGTITSGTSGAFVVIITP